MRTRVAILTICAAICASSCHSSHADGQGSTAATNPTQNEVTFEIKNLTWTYTPRKSLALPGIPSKTESWDYKGHAIIVSKAPFLQQGTTFVAFEYRATPPSSSAAKEWELASTEFNDGAGEVDLTVYYDADRYKENPGPPKLEWRIQGFLRLSPAKVTVEE
jgi:hypothetical protein